MHAGLAALCWVPLLLTAPGRVAADTRAHLYLDAGEFVDRARFLWDPMVHMGTVTHQNLGLVAPMGLWFRLVELIDMPVWIGQRLWVGAILFAAGAGVGHLGRTLGWALTGSAASAVVYALSPYVLQYATRTSVLLLPFAGLPWLLSLVIRAARSGGWRHPAAFALVVGLVGSVNATALVLVGLAPVLWLAHAAVSRDIAPRRVAATGARIGVMCLGTSAWWIAGLWVQSRHGLPVLTYTETLEQVSTTSAAPEVLRGLGYWVFYGREVLDPNVGAAVAYTQNPFLLAVTYALSALALAAAFAVRFPQRTFFVLLTVVGVVVAVGAYPVEDPSISASLFRHAADSTAGLAMRSSTRAVPLVALGLAVFLGRGVDALDVRSATRRRIAAGVALSAVVALPALMTGGFVDPNFSRPAEVPGHWRDAAAFLQGASGDGAVLELPGIQFATYRWGTTYEPITPGLLDRPVIAREQLPYGSAPSADLLIALDRRLQEGVFEPEAVAPVARLMGAEWILVRNDLAFERYTSARPERLWYELGPLPDSLEAAASFGRGIPNQPDARLPLLDEEALSIPPDADAPAAIELLRVDDPLDRVRVEPVAGAILLAGDGEGVVDAAAAGLLDARRPLFYGATLVEHPDLLDEALAEGARIVVTDTARKRARRWRSVRWSTGYTERADEETTSENLGEGDLEVFEDPPPAALTTVIQAGGTVDASVYGGPFTLDPDARPALAVDGRIDTAWVVGPITDPVGARLRVRPDDPVTTDRVTIVQRQAPGSANRITALDLRIGAGEPVRVALDERSLGPDGQAIDLGGRRSVDELELAIASTLQPPELGGSPVGIAEVRIGELTVEEIVELPSALVDAAAAGAADVPLAYVLTRLRADPAEPVRGDEEQVLRRRFRVPAPRPFDLAGSARLAADAPSRVVAALLGITSPEVHASTSLPGRPANGALSALDGDPTTAWRPAFPDPSPWIEVRLAEPTNLDRLDLGIVADGDHSLPTSLELSVDGALQRVDLPPILPGDTGAVRNVTVPVAAMRGRDIRVTVTGTQPRSTVDYYTRAHVATPVGLAELRLPGLEPVAPGAIHPGCRDDLVTLDGRPVPVAVSGSAADALAGRALDLRGCAPVELDTGAHDLRAADGADTGLDLDRLTLGTGATVPAVPSAAPPIDRLERTSPTGYDGRIGPGGPGWLVVAQSHESGWTATLDGEQLGEPVLIDGGFNGWRIPAAEHARDLRLEWEPQQTVTRATWLSALTAVLAVVVVTGGWWRTRRAAEHSLREAPASPEPVGWAQRALRWQLAMVPYAALAAAVGLLTVGPLVAVAAAGATVLALRRPFGHVLIAVGALGCWLGAAGMIVAGQILDPRRPDYEWLEAVRGPHWLTMTALALLAAAASAGALRARQSADGPERTRAETAASSAATSLRRSPPARAARAVQRRWRAGRDARAGRPAPADARRFLWASVAGGVAATLLFAWMLTLGRFDMTSWQRVGDYYDGQAAAWLDGRWDIAPETLGIERFEARGRSYMYQGPWPAMLRLPVAAVTDRFEGRLTQSSMLLAFVVAVVAAIALHWRIRRLVRGAAPVTTAEAAATAVVTFAVTGGSALLYLGSRAWVYHEAAIWGTAWAIAGLSAVLAYVTGPRWRRLGWATLTTTLALWSRSSVGIGPLAALALVTGGNVAVHARALLARGAPQRRGTTILGRLLDRLRWAGTAPDASGRVPLVAPAVAALVPVAAYAAVNWIKFRTFFSIPFDRQGFTIVDEQRRAMLAANDGTLFGLHFSPTTALQYLRPDALSIEGKFPFVDFPALADPIGDVVFDLIDRSTSVPVSMAVLCVLTLVGAVALARGASSLPGTDLAAIRAPLLGGFAGALTIIPFGYIANRYLADAVPFLAVGAFVGLQVLIVSLCRRGTARRGARHLALAALTIGVAAATWINLSLGLSYQRLYSPNVDDDVMAAYLDTTYDVSQSLGVDPDIPIDRGEHLPETAPRGSLFALGDCDALYLSDGMDTNAIKITPWNPVERTEDGGRYRRLITFPDRPPGTREPLLSAEAPDGRKGVLYAEWRGGAGIAFGYVQDVAEGQRAVDELSPTRHVPAGRTFSLDLVADHEVQRLVVWLDDEIVLEIYLELDPDALNVLARNTTDRHDIAPAFTGALVPLPERTGLCRELVRESDRWR